MHMVGNAVCLACACLLYTSCSVEASAPLDLVPELALTVNIQRCGLAYCILLSVSMASYHLQ